MAAEMPTATGETSSAANGHRSTLGSAAQT
jgi:hypothetical protein